MDFLIQIMKCMVVLFQFLSFLIFIFLLSPPLHCSTQTLLRQGHSLALGALPKVMVSGQLMRIMTGLIEVTQVTQREEKMAEARRDGVKALAR